jgi:micrococcal nuclease
MQQNEYDVTVVKVVDGDTVDVNIELGFGIVLADERVRIMGIDTPESRTSDRVEKLFGKASSKRLGELLANGAKLITTENKSGEDMKGKFGRVLGDFRAADGRLVTEIMSEEGHCVPYFGGSKGDTQAQHEVNRQKLLAEGVVDKEQYDKMVIAEANEK